MRRRHEGWRKLGCALHKPSGVPIVDVAECLILLTASAVAPSGARLRSAERLR